MAKFSPAPYPPLAKARPKTVDVEKSVPLPVLSNAGLDSIELSPAPVNFVYSQGGSKVSREDKKRLSRIESLIVDGERKTLAAASSHAIGSLIATAVKPPGFFLTKHHDGQSAVDGATLDLFVKHQRAGVLEDLKVAYDKVQNNPNGPDPHKLKLRYGGDDLVEGLGSALVPPDDYEGTQLQYVREHLMKRMAFAAGHEKTWMENAISLIEFRLRNPDAWPKTVSASERKLYQWIKKQQTGYLKMMGKSAGTANAAVLTPERYAIHCAIGTKLEGSSDLARVVKEYPQAVQEWGTHDYPPHDREHQWLIEKLMYYKYEWRNVPTKTQNILIGLGFRREYSAPSEARVWDAAKRRVKALVEYHEETKKVYPPGAEILPPFPANCVGEYAHLRRMVGYFWELKGRQHSVLERDARKKDGESQPKDKDIADLTKVEVWAIEELGKFYDFDAPDHTERHTRVEWKENKYSDEMIVDEHGNPTKNNSYDVPIFYSYTRSKSRPDRVKIYEFPLATGTVLLGVVKETDERGHATYGVNKTLYWMYEAYFTLTDPAGPFKCTSVVFLRWDTGFRYDPLPAQLEYLKTVEEDMIAVRRDADGGMVGSEVLWPGAHYKAVDFSPSNLHVRAAFRRKIPPLDGCAVARNKDEIDRPLFRTVELLHTPPDAAA